MQALYFTATWCQPCKVFGPVMAKVAIEDVVVSKIDIEREPAFTDDWGVMSVPTVILYEDNKEISRKLGAQTYETMREWIQGYKIGA